MSEKVEKQPLAARVSMDDAGVVAALRAHVEAGRQEALATEAVDAGQVPGVVIVPSHNPGDAGAAARLAVMAGMQARF
jgi:hypothetical protein